jgi:hypothetical protein
MKKIGFIDYYLDEWHAIEYPKLIKQLGGNEFEIALAWGKIDNPKGGLTNAQWSEKLGISLAGSLEEVVEKCDYLVVLSPDNPEMHEELARIPLMSGKRVFIDKTFSPDGAAARRMFELAKEHGTPCYSSSALNFATEYQGINKDEVLTVQTTGPGAFENYSVHQIEPLILLMGTGAKRVMSIGTSEFPALAVEFLDGRIARTSHFPDAGFSALIGYKDGHSEQVVIASAFFEQFAKDMLAFFRTGDIPVSHERTLAAMDVRGAGKLALERPFEWVDVAVEVK